MAEVITRFKLETTQFDSKLRDAAKELRDVAKEAERGGKDFNNFSQKSVEAARSLGNVASGAKNTKDRVKDLVGAYNEAAKAYNSLTQAQQQSDFGKALAQSIGQLKDRISEAKQELYGLNDAMGKAGGGGLFSGLGDKMSGMMQVFGGNLLAQGVANLTSELVGSVQQSIELAREGEGVRIAFERLNRPGLLDNLKEATHGTVSEVELMKQAIKFENFKLPVEDLATYLGFAQQKAKDTGESIDYLVNSIVNGLGRQSKQILDNLGISAAELTKRMDEGATMTQAVADIIREEMAKAGDYVETAADRAARATAKATDEAEAFGREAMPIAQEWEETWAVLKSGAMSFAQTLLGPVAKSLRSIQNILNSGPDVDDYANRLIEEAIKRQEQGKGSTQAILQKIGYQGLNNLQTVHAPGGYVVVSDGNGNVLGQRHFDDLSGVDAWRASLGGRGGRRGGGRTVRNTPPKKTPLELLQERTNRVDYSQFYTAASNRGEEIPLPFKPTIVKQSPEELKAELDAMYPTDNPYELPVKPVIKDTKKDMQEFQKAAGLAAQAVSSIGDAFAGIEDPSAKAAGMVMQAIASIALGFATASTNANTAGTGWGWLAWLAAGAAAMATTISTIHSLTGFENGGEIKGNSYSGDNIPIMANAGEVVLTRAMAGNLASQLEGAATNVHVTGEVHGTKLVLVMNRALKVAGKGEIVTWK